MSSWPNRSFTMYSFGSAARDNNAAVCRRSCQRSFCFAAGNAAFTAGRDTRRRTGCANIGVPLGVVTAMHPGRLLRGGAGPCARPASSRWAAAGSWCADQPRSWTGRMTGYGLLLVLPEKGWSDEDAALKEPSHGAALSRCGGPRPVLFHAAPRQGPSPPAPTFGSGNPMVSGL